MRYRKLSPTGDFVFGNQQKDFWKDVPNAPGQAVETRLLLFKGEWFLDIDVGVPLLEGILGNHTKSLADATIQDTAVKTQGVSQIQNYESTINPDTRAMTASFDVQTIYGPTDVQISNYRNF